MSPRKGIAGLVFLLVLLFFIPWLIGYLRYGQLVITTDNSLDSIALTMPVGSNNSGNKAFSKQAKGSLSVRLKAGGYLVDVQRGPNETSQYVVVKAHAATRVNIKLPSIGGVEPVVYDNAQNIVADSSRLLYLDPDDSSLNQIDSQNQHTEMDASYGFSSISWASTSYGVGQTAAGQLFVINNGMVSPLKSPVSGNNDSGVVFAVASNRDIYIGAGSSVYSGTDTGSFKKISDSRPSKSVLIAGPNNVALLNTGYSGGTPSLTALNALGKQTAVSLSSFANAWSNWSQHDKYLAVSSGPSGEIFDASLHKVAVIPQANFSSAVWLDDNTLFYGINDQLWAYDMRAGSSRLVASMPFGEQIREITVSADGSYVYLTSSDANSNITIRRVPLDGQKVPAIVYQLQDILPLSNSSGGYALGLFNFSGTPAVDVVASDGSNQQTVLQAAMQQLQSSGFDLSQLKFKVEQGD
jgi:hypothetical protein